MSKVPVGSSTVVVWLLLGLSVALAVAQVLKDQFAWAAIVAAVLAAVNNALRSWQANTPADAG